MAEQSTNTVPGTSDDPIQVAFSGVAPKASENLSKSLAHPNREQLRNLHDDCIRRVDQMVVAARTYHDGVVLAAEQVQDKRIEFLESPKETSWAPIFIEIGLVFLLESPIALILVKMVAQRASHAIRFFSGELSINRLQKKFTKRLRVHRTRVSKFNLKIEKRKIDRYHSPPGHIKAIDKQIAGFEKDLRKAQAAAAKEEHNLFKVISDPHITSDAVARTLIRIDANYGVGLLKAAKAGVEKAQWTLPPAAQQSDLLWIKTKPDPIPPRITAADPADFDTIGVSLRNQAQEVVRKIELFANDIQARITTVMSFPFLEGNRELQKVDLAFAVSLLQDIRDTLEAIPEDTDWLKYKRTVSEKMELVIWAHILIPRYLSDIPSDVQLKYRSQVTPNKVFQFGGAMPEMLYLYLVRRFLYSKEKSKSKKALWIELYEALVDFQTASDNFSVNEPIVTLDGMPAFE